MSETVTQIQEQRPPAWILPYLERMAAGATQVSSQGYTPYGGQRVAGFTPMEQASMQGIAALGMAGAPQQFRNAMGQQNMAMGMAAQAPMMGYNDLSGAAGTGYNDLRGVAGLMGNQQSWPGANHAAYMNPYQQNVTDVAARDIQRQADRQTQALGSRAAAQGAFGGSRHGMVESQIARDAREQVGDISYMGQRDAYNAGMGQFNADRAARMQGLLGEAGTLGQANRLYQSGLGQANQLYQSGIGQLFQGAGQSAALGAQGQNMALQRLGAMGQAGQQQRGLQQSMLDVGFNDFLRQQNWGRDQIGFLSSILQGMPYQNTSGYQSTSQNNPGLFQSGLGAGITGLAMASQHNQQALPPGTRQAVSAR